MPKELERCERCDINTATLICHECNTIFCKLCVKDSPYSCPDCPPPQLEPYDAEEIEP